MRLFVFDFILQPRNFYRPDDYIEKARISIEELDIKIKQLEFERDVWVAFLEDAPVKQIIPFEIETVENFK